MSFSGQAAEHRQMASWMEKGYSVFQPVTEGAQVDYIIADGVGVYLCQSKKATQNASGVSISAKKVSRTRNGHRLHYSNIDLFVLTFNDQHFVVPEDVGTETQITLGIEPSSTSPPADKYRMSEFPDSSYRQERRKTSPNKRANAVECTNCGQEFNRPKHRVKDKNYCSQRCYREHRETATERLPDREWLRRMQKQYSYRHLARRLGVSVYPIYKKIKREE
jgi:hypothetical protein